MDEKKNKENYYGYKSHINDDQREKLITAEQKASNTEKSIIRSRDEIIFSAQSSHGSTLRSNNRNDESGLQYNPSGDPSGDASGIRLGIYLGQLN